MRKKNRILNPKNNKHIELIKTSGSKILENYKVNQYHNLLSWFKTLSIRERKQYIIELIIDIYFMEYDESELTTD